MRIVHVLRQFHPAVGGVESVALELAAAQVAAGHVVRVVTLDRLFTALDGPKLPPRDRIAGAEVVRIPFRGSPRYPIAPAVLLHLGDADIVHVHWTDFFFDFLALTKPLHRKRLVISTHGGFFHTRRAARLKELYFTTMTRLSLTAYDLVVAGSVADQELFGRLRRKRMVCIETGVNTTKYADAGSLRSVKTIAWIGRFADNKRLDRLVAFVAAMRQRDPEWRLKVAGVPADLGYSDVIALAQAAGVAHAVDVFVSPTDDQLRHLLADCAVLASSSEYEGFGLVAVEGMSAGLFALLSDIPTFRRIVARAGVGMIVDYTDAAAAAGAFLAKWPQIAAEYPLYRNKAMEAASEYHWRRVSQAYTQSYETLCSGNPLHHDVDHRAPADFTGAGLTDDQLTQRTIQALPPQPR
jgi:alpha-1,3-mannosyltransferase